ncbi:hypothetical protein GALMADRAFT_131500 [Galerina marginata CBS 339.88]|uniref:Uncharacterized protein n=1 Tax=Galerina marginata (strain CBS 339.88) TaxID=685588 RepID=A0A067U042_GALM3|nr:hypothetical protein GALMADRAFT_131500 [Galerina marginata CBS 339.88]
MQRQYLYSPHLDLLRLVSNAPWFAPGFPASLFLTTHPFPLRAMTSTAAEYRLVPADNDGAAAPAPLSLEHGAGTAMTRAHASSLLCPRPRCFSVTVCPPCNRPAPPASPHCD